MSKPQWYRFAPPSHEAQYGYGVEEQARQYAEWLNRNRDRELWEFEGLGESPELEQSTEAFLIADALEAIENFQPYTFRNLKPKCPHYTQFITVEAESLMDAVVMAAWEWGWRKPVSYVHDASSDQVTLLAEAQPGDGNVIGKFYWSR